MILNPKILSLTKIKGLECIEETGQESSLGEKKK